MKGNKTLATGALSSINGAARLINEASPTPTSLEKKKKTETGKKPDHKRHRKHHNAKDDDRKLLHSLSSSPRGVDLSKDHATLLE